MSSNGDGEKRIEAFLKLCKGRNPAEILRVRYWYQGVRERMHCRTAYQLQLHYEPQSFVKTDKRIQYPNKWKGYERGENTPRCGMVGLVDKENPGSERELNHPLWLVLREGESVCGNIDHWFKQLDPYVQVAVYHQSKDGVGGAKRRPAINLTLGRELVRRANLDALAALLLYWFEAHQSGRREDADQLARLIYSAMLIIGVEFIRRDMAEEVFITFRAMVFEKTDWLDGRFDTDSSFYMHSVRTLHGLLSYVKEVGPQATWSEKAGMMMKLLDGDKGLDVLFAMRVELAPNWESGPPTREQVVQWKKNHCLWEWGWRHLNRGTQGREFDDELEDMFRQVVA